MELSKYLQIAIDASYQAGIEILEIYNAPNPEIVTKKDDSPLTKADIKSNDIISKLLSQTGLPILSEEGKNISFNERASWELYWLIDPLDGTKEFIKKNGEFTVNIALIKNQVPIMGVVYCPVKNWMYFGSEESESIKIENFNTINSKVLTLPIVESEDNVRVIGSRSHYSEEIKNFITFIEKNSGKKVEVISMGSSLKLCLVAEGKAEYYPRFGPTMEWDTAAAHAVVKFAGGYVKQISENLEIGSELIYNKKELLNPYFVVSLL